MKKLFLFTIIAGLTLNSCENPNKKEIGEVDELISMIEDSEKSLLSVDTSVVFAAKRQMDIYIADINSLNDTLTREEAFQLEEFFGSKKRLHKIMGNYPGFIRQIEFSKDPLNNLKQDLENGLIKKEDFKTHYVTEQAEIMSLNAQINKAVGGLDFAVEKLESDKSAILEFIENKKLKAADNE